MFSELKQKILKSLTNNMIGEIIRLLNTGEFKDVHPFIEIAKGKYKIHNNLRKIYKQEKRAVKWRLRKQ